MFWGTLTDSTLGASHSVLSSAIFAITHPNPFSCYHAAAGRPSVSCCPLFGATVLLVSVLWQSLISCFFFFFFCPHLPAFLPLPALRSHLWLSIPHCSPLCSPFLVALCRCQIRPNSTTHKEGLNSLWFTSRYQTFLDAECGPLNRCCEHKMRTQ